MRGRSWSGVLAAFLAVGSLAACSVLQSGPHDQAQSELNRQRRHWRAQDVEEYAYTVRRLCFCPETFTSPVVVRVRGGEVESRVYEGSGAPVDAGNASFWPEVEGLFDLVQDAIDRDADAISVEYHPQLGYPIAVRIDYEEMAADEELTVTASNLTR